jgi:hypothetical protein
VTVLIQCTSVWFAGSKFGLSWKAKQIRMDRVPESIRGYAFLEDDDAPARPAARSSAPVGTNKFAALHQEEEEDDAEAEEDDAFQAPAPAKTNVLAAMMPKAPAPAPAPAPAAEEEPEDHEPIPAPKKTSATAVKRVVAAKGVKKA